MKVSEILISLSPDFIILVSFMCSSFLCVWFFILLLFIFLDVIVVAVLVVFIIITLARHLDCCPRHSSSSSFSSSFSSLIFQSSSSTSSSGWGKDHSFPSLFPSPNHSFPSRPPRQLYQHQWQLFINFPSSSSFTIYYCRHDQPVSNLLKKCLLCSSFKQAVYKLLGEYEAQDVITAGR